MRDQVTSALTGLLRTAGGTRTEQIARALALLAERLGLRAAYLGEWRDGAMLVTHREFPFTPVDPGFDAEALCRLVIAGEAGPVIGDATTQPLLAGHGVGAFAGAPLRADGRVVGAVCVASAAPAPTLNERDEATLRAIAAHLSDLLVEPPGGPPAPADGAGAAVHAGLRRLADAVSAGRDLESLARPLLQLLQEITGLDSTYLTLVDPDADEQVIAFACNIGQMEIPEGLTVPWQDTLCRRSLTEGRQCVSDVPAVWGDSQAARDLGIVTYVSVPVRDAADEVLGTLCGASGASQPLDDRDLAVMDTFAKLVSAQLAREFVHSAAAARADALEERMTGLRDAVERDPLTGLANRTGVRRWLQATLDRLALGERLAVAFVDLDRFKEINDTRGHAIGDDVLRLVGAALARTGRPDDLHGRLGGDEFVVAAVLPAGADEHAWGDRLRDALAATEVDGVRVSGSVGVICAAEPAMTVDDLLHHADTAMYREKSARRAGVRG